MAAHLKILFLIAVISFAVYVNSLHNSFHFDDQHYITANPYIRDISNIPTFFKSPQYSSFEKVFTGHYRPLLIASYAINYAIGGLNPVGYHLVNLIFHIGSAFMLFLIVQAVMVSSEQLAVSSKQSAGKNKEGGFSAYSSPLTAHAFVPLAAALIFAVHPFNSEVVNYITARSSVMCSFFYLLSFYCWVKYRSQKSEVRSQKKSYFLPLTSYFYLASLLAFLLAMLTKELAITLPVMLFLYDLYFRRPVVNCHPEPCPELDSGSAGRHPELVSGSQNEEILKRVQNDSRRGSVKGSRNKFGMTATMLFSSYLAYLPFIFLVAIPYLAYRMFIAGSIIGKGSHDFYANLLTQPMVLLKYLQLLFLPVGLTIEHDIARVNTIYDGWVFFSAITLLIIMTSAYLLFRRGGEWRILSFFIIWFFITLLPTTLIPLNAILQENRGYLGGAGFGLFVGLCLWKLCFARSGDTILNSRKELSMVSPEFRQRFFMLLLLILLTFYSVLTIQRSYVWKDDYTLWTDAVYKAPSSARAHDNLGLAHITRGEYDLAIAEFKKTLNLNPRYYLAHYNAGVVYQFQNRLDMARSSYEECITINPAYFRAHYNIGIVYKKTGDLDKAVSAYKKAISIDPRHPFVYNNLGVALMEKGDIAGAETVFKKAIKLNPAYYKAYFNLGNSYFKRGDHALAADAYRSALGIKPDYKEAEEMLKITGSPINSRCQ